jgi:thiol-disulfide isomerase/thioredoxin
LIKEFETTESLNRALGKQKPVFIAYIPPDNTEDMVNYVITAKNSASLSHKFGLVSDINVIGGATTKIPAKLDLEQVVVWFSDRIGDLRGWKMKIFDKGLKGFDEFLKKCTYPTLVHYRGKESHNVFKGSGLPQVFFLFDNEKMDQVPTLVHPLAVELLGDFVIMTINIDTHPKMLDHFTGADVANLPDVFFRPIPSEVLGLDDKIKRSPSHLSDALRAIYRDYSSKPPTRNDGHDQQFSPGSVLDMKLKEFGEYTLESDIAILVAFTSKGAPVNERVRGALEETLDSTRHLIEETVFIHVEVADGISSVTPPEGIHILSLPVLLLRRHGDGKWFQFENDISFAGVLKFLTKHLNLSSDLVEEITGKHKSLLLENIQNSPHEDDGAGVPDQMVEDDEYGKFVALEKIQCSDYKAFELTPLEYENAVLSEGGAVVVFFQPWSVRSKAFLPHMKGIQSLLEGKKAAVATVNCQSYPDVCDSLNITTYPTVWLYRNKGEEREVFKGVQQPLDIVNTFLKTKTTLGHELTVSSLPALFAEGKPLVILVLPSEESTLVGSIEELGKEHPELTVVWVNFSKHSNLLAVNGSRVNEGQLPMWIAMDTVKDTMEAMYTCRARTLQEATKCLEAKWTELPWRQSSLSPKQWLPRVKPFQFPSNAVESTEEGNRYQKDDTFPENTVQEREPAKTTMESGTMHRHEEL